MLYAQLLGVRMCVRGVMHGVRGRYSYPRGVTIVGWPGVTNCPPSIYHGFAQNGERAIHLKVTVQGAGVFQVADQPR